MLERAPGALLCIAAALKGLDFRFTHITSAETLFGLVVIVIELAVGMALLLWLLPAISIPIGGLLFLLLAGVSWVGTTRGATSCGCFGSLVVPPWVLLILDVLCAGVLFWSLRASYALSRNRVVVLGMAAVCSLYVGQGIGTSLYPRLGSVTAETSKEAIAAAKTVFVEPGRLRGRAFPFFDYIQINANLSQGKWKLIFVRPECGRCEQRLRTGTCQPEPGARVAVVLAQAKEGWTLPPECKAILGQLSEQKTWNFETPLILDLVDGKVTEVR
jgi:hypothetical protein